MINEGPKKLWKELRDIPIDENECIETPFYHFLIGTDRFEIWNWFEDTFNLSVKDDLMDG